jgi:hypothetical protein
MPSTAQQFSSTARSRSDVTREIEIGREWLNSVASTKVTILVGKTVAFVVQSPPAES